MASAWADSEGEGVLHSYIYVPSVERNLLQLKQCFKQYSVFYGNCHSETGWTEKQQCNASIKIHIWLYEKFTNADPEGWGDRGPEPSLENHTNISSPAKRY